MVVGHDHSESWSRSLGAPALDSLLPALNSRCVVRTTSHARRVFRLRAAACVRARDRVSLCYVGRCAVRRVVLSGVTLSQSHRELSERPSQFRSFCVPALLPVPVPRLRFRFRGSWQLRCLGLLQVLQENTGGVWKCLILRAKKALRRRDATLWRDRCNAFP